MGPLSVFTQYLRGTHYHWRTEGSDGMGWVWPLPRTCKAEDLYCIKVELLLVFMISILCYIYLSIYLFVYLFCGSGN